MRYDHKEANSFLFSGECDFEVLTAEERVNPYNGREEINMKLLIENAEGRKANFFASLSALKPWHIKNFCLATGISLEKFESNELKASDCENKKGRCVMKIFKDKNNEDKSGVNKWIPVESLSNNSAPKPLEPNSVKTEDLNDDIPF